MNVAIIVPREALERAIGSANNAGAGSSLDGLNSLLNGVELGMLSDMWENITNAIRKAHQLGIERVRSILDGVIADCRQTLDAAGAAAANIQEALRLKLSQLVQSYVDSALAMIRSKLTVGGSEMSIRSVEVEQKIVLGGELGLSLEQVFKLAASGEMTVSATYGAP